MNNFGKMAPALIDANLLKQATIHADMQELISTTPLTNEFEKIGLSVVYFFKSYWLYIVGLILIVGYISYCYYQHKETKKKYLSNNLSNNLHSETNRSIPDDYTCSNNVEISKRSKPEYYHNDINKKIRNMYLQELNPKPKSTIHRPCNATDKLPKLHYGLPPTIHENPITAKEYRSSAYNERIPILKNLPSNHSSQLKKCYKQKTYEPKIVNLHNEKIGHMTSISQTPLSNHSQQNNQYGDTFYEAPIKRCNESDSEDFDDQFYGNSSY